MTTEQTINEAAKKTRQEKKPKAAAGEQPAKSDRRPFTLAVDIGGTGIKAEKLDATGRPITERTKIATPGNATPKKVTRIIEELSGQHGAFERVSVGFPGVVKDGIVYTAANLGKGWNDYPLQKELAKKLRKPVRMANDADVQGL